MKLISIEINNFRQFYGKQKLFFSTDNKKNVTLIHGENNGGKTALLNALRWCLYKETTDNLLDPEHLLNKHAKAIGDNQFHVFVQLVHENSLFELRRYKKRTGTIELKVYKIKEGTYAPDVQEKPQFFINTILPNEMSKYFFYQGEGTGTLSSASDFSNIKSSIEKVLGFTVAQETKRHIKRIKNNYERQLGELDATGEINSALATRDRLEKHQEQLKNKLIEDEQSLKINNNLFETVNKNILLADIDIIKGKVDARRNAESYLSTLKSSETQIEIHKRTQLCKWVSNAYTEKLSKFDLSSIDTENLKEKIKYSISKDLLKEILTLTQCVCGNDVKEGSSAYKVISELSKHAVEPELKARWKRAKDLSASLKSSKKGTFEAMALYMKNVEENQINQQKQINLIDEVSAQIKDINISDINKLEFERDRLKRLVNTFTSQIALGEEAVKLTKNELIDLDTRIRQLSQNQPEVDKIKKLIFATEKISNLYQTELDNAVNGIDGIILKNMQELFASVAFNGYTVAKNGDSWKIVDMHNQNVAAGNGYQAMLAISFVISLIKFSSDRVNDSRYLLTPGTVAPFIADSILAFIGPDNGRELVRFIAESVEQSIFMFSQAQWTTTHIDKGIRNRIGREYNLVQHTTLSKNEFKGQYPSSLNISGNTFEVVKFNSDFDRVTIEEIKIDESSK